MLEVEEKMLITEIMSTPVVTIEMDDSLATAMNIFEHTKFHHLLVVDDNNKLVGVVSDRDILKAISPNIGSAAEKPQDLATLNKKVHQVMSRQPICLKATDRVRKVVETFDDNRISCIPIVNEEQKPVGIVSWRDIIKALRSKYGDNTPS